MQRINIVLVIHLETDMTGSHISICNIWLVTVCVYSVAHIEVLLVHTANILNPKINKSASEYLVYTAL